MPEALKILQPCGWLLGPRNCDTLKVVPKLNWVGNVKGTSPVTNKLSPALSCSSIVSPGPTTSPLTLPPTENFGCGHEIWMVATVPLIVPLPFETLQVCAGEVGWLRMVTA